MTDNLIAAYTDRLSYAPGADISLFVSGPTDTVKVELVAISGLTLDGAGNAQPIEWDGSGTYEIHEQPTCIGSFMVGDLLDYESGSPLSLGSYLWMPQPGFETDQTVGSVDDGSVELRLVVRNSRLVAEVVSAGTTIGSVSAAAGIAPHRWTFAAASIGPGGELAVFCWSATSGVLDFAAVETEARAPHAKTVAFAAAKTEGVQDSGGVLRGRARDFYNGKLQSPFVARTALTEESVLELVKLDEPTLSPTLDLVGAWDLAPYPDLEPNSAKSLTGGPNAKLVNMPASAVTGRHWNGTEMSFVHAPKQWGAAHFHEEDLVDAGWNPLLKAKVPADLPSAIYGIRVTGSETSDTVPVVVIPTGTSARSSVTVVLPTFTYLAYANEQLYAGLDHAAVSDKPLVLDDLDRRRLGRPEFGISMYDHHSDGSGVMYSSASRPVLNMRYDNRMWLSGSPRHLSAEMLLINWLTKLGIAFDVVTDLDLHNGGAGLLDGTRVVITGSHPEYYTLEMIDGLADYTARGGNLMYLGANGFYWVTGVASEQPLVIEIRRGLAGIRTWESYPGETVLMSTREQGGLWRHRGRTPNLLVGVGMAAQGWGSSEPYWRTDASRGSEFAWVFDGVDEEPIGDYGLVMGGAAGDELDRFDHSLGSPTDAVILASSRNHTKYYQRVVEEVAMNFPGYGGGDQDPEVHADMVYFTTAGGGRVFSVGSIAWSGSLLENDGDNGVSRITENVLREFTA